MCDRSRAVVIQNIWGEERGKHMKRSLLGWLFLLVCLPSSAAYAGYSNLFIFGDSLSDSGNNAVVLAPNVTPVPISGNAFIPTFPYASGHYTNGQVWAQSFALSLGLSANPSILGGTDYAFGGARTGPLTPNPFPGGLFNPFPPSLETQVAFFLLQHANVAPARSLCGMCRISASPRRYGPRAPRPWRSGR